MLIDNKKDALELIDYLNGFETLTVDTETTGLRPYQGDRICGFAIKAEKSYYLPFRHSEGKNLDLSLIESHLKPLLSHPDKTYIGFNYKFDLIMMLMDNIPLPKNIEEVMAMAHLMNENEKETLTKAQKEEFKKNGWVTPGYKLKYLAAKYINASANDESEILIDKILERKLTKSRDEAKGLMYMLPASDVAPYACSDTDLTKSLFDFYLKHLHIWRLYEIYRETCEYHLITTKMEYRGIKVDVDLIHKYMAEAEANIIPSTERLNKLAGYQINANSPKQVQALLGVPSADKDALQKIIEGSDEEKKEIASAVLECRGWNKVNNTYYKKYLKLIDDENKLHPQLSLIGTVSRRATCFEPNLQTIPRFNKVFKVKNIFIVKEGYKFVSADYSQAELRLAAHYMEEMTEQYIQKMERIIATGNAKQINWAKSEIKRVSQAYEETLSYILMNNLDFHQEAATAIKRDRYTGKQLNFMVQYGVGGAKLAKKLWLPTSEGYEILEKYHTRFPGYNVVKTATEAIAEAQGYIRVWNGNICHFKSERDYYKASSRLIQGGVAEIMRETIIRLERELPETSEFLLQVHDNVIYQLPDDDNFIPTIELMKTIMEDHPLWRVPTKVDIHVGYDLGHLELV